MSVSMGSLLAALAMVPGGIVQETPLPEEGPDVQELTVEPSDVRAGMFFHGASILVTALAPPDMELSITCIGRREEVVLGRKGKALGIIWMNVGEVAFEGLPDLYLVHTSASLARMGTPATRDSLGLGYAALRRGVTVTGADGDEDFMFRELVSLRESDGLYGVQEGTVDLEDNGEAMAKASVELTLPAKTPPGDYLVQVHGFQESDGVLLGEATLRVEQVGMAAAIRTLAARHGLVYGIFAVVIAIAVGLLTGVLFGLGSKKAH